jgi:hypothetical protein
MPYMESSSKSAEVLPSGPACKPEGGRIIGGHVAKMIGQRSSLTAVSGGDLTAVEMLARDCVVRTWTGVEVKAGNERIDRKNTANRSRER